MKDFAVGDRVSPKGLSIVGTVIGHVDEFTWIEYENDPDRELWDKNDLESHVESGVSA